MRSEEILTPEEISTYARWLNLVNSTGVAYAIGGAFAVHTHTGIWRNTKDLDLFVRPADVKPILEVMVESGYETEITNPAWLAKVRFRPYSMDLIFCLSNGYHVVDEVLLSRRQRHSLQHIETSVMAVEELITTKAFIAKHHRFDGPDIAHLIRSRSAEIDWEYLLTLFGDHYELLLW
ncbi:MAG: nucleotidyl transferase, partial [Chloroflexi bacterium]